MKVTKDDAYLDIVLPARGIGTILIPSGQGLPQNQLVHETSKMAGAHHVTYGNGYSSLAPVVDSVSGYKVDATPYVTFNFNYRPMSILISFLDGPSPEYSCQNGRTCRRGSPSHRVKEIETGIGQFGGELLRRSFGIHLGSFTSGWIIESQTECLITLFLQHILYYCTMNLDHKLSSLVPESRTRMIIVN
ncbi:hypothetical protein Hypma_010722 [Hypsizygus marmoreus]|uniref:Uncharacterized protein n=1 Tax=Hypsizygus marmoreus TaxID=39966 RepID=A0A369JLI8_HYPMA|nr:hypothetical protein Hypma_010722 [Hypsizygus marmoreus]